MERHAAGDAAPGAYDLADALVAGDRRATLALADEPEAHGERPGRLLYPIVRRLREVHRAAALLEAGMSEQKVGEALRAPSWLAKKTVARAKRPIPPHWSRPCACSPTSRWTCAAVGTCSSTRTPRSRWRSPGPRPSAKLARSDSSALPNDAAVVAAIYNEGIEERSSTFETARRSAADVEAWLEAGERLPLLVAEEDATVSGWARIARYSEREAYAGRGGLGVRPAKRPRPGRGRRLLTRLSPARDGAGLLEAHRQALQGERRQRRVGTSLWLAGGGNAPSPRPPRRRVAG